jgi:DNA-binding NarL/FixJ family response regulator
VLVDEQPVIRTGLRILLSEQPTLAIVGEADDCEHAIRLILREEPDLVIVALDQFDETELARLAEALLPSDHTRILAVSSSEGTDAVLRAVRAGALGIVGQNEPIGVLVAAISSVHAREAWYQRRSVATILRTLLREHPALSVDPETARLEVLTKREREIVRLVAEGLTNRVIAERLFISEVTVRHHLTSIFAKLGITNRVELLGFAHRVEIGR